MTDAPDPKATTAELGDWVAERRARRDAGELPSEQLEALEGLDDHGRRKPDHGVPSDTSIIE